MWHGKNGVAVKMVNNKVVENFFMYLVLKFQDHRPKSLGVMAVQS